MNTHEESFAKSIKNLRHSMGLTQQEMADIIGVRKTTICNYESGYSQPTINTLKLLMEKFDLPSTYFFNDPLSKRRISQQLYGITIPFYEPTNIKGLLSKNKQMMDSHLSLPMQLDCPKNGTIATCAPDNSMNLCGIKRGCGIIINTTKAPSDGDVFAAVHNDNLIIRKYHNNYSGTYMSAESTRIPAGLSIEEIPGENFTFLGIITKLITTF